MTPIRFITIIAFGTTMPGLSFVEVRHYTVWR